MGCGVSPHRELLERARVDLLQPGALDGMLESEVQGWLARLAEALEQSDQYRQEAEQAAFGGQELVDSLREDLEAANARAETADRREQDLLKLAEEKGWGYFYDQRYDNAMVEVVRLRDALAKAERAAEATVTELGAFKSELDEMVRQRDEWSNRYTQAAMELDHEPCGGTGLLTDDDGDSTYECAGCGGTGYETESLRRSLASALARQAAAVQALARAEAERDEARNTAVALESIAAEAEQKFQDCLGSRSTLIEDRDIAEARAASLARDLAAANQRLEIAVPLAEGLSELVGFQRILSNALRSDPSRVDLAIQALESRDATWQKLEASADAWAAGRTEQEAGS